MTTETKTEQRRETSPVIQPSPPPMDVRIVGSTLQLGALSLTFHRTLRIPDNGRQYPLPPSLGAFPLRHVDDYADRVPASWRERGGVFLPMYQREAMWISFSARQHEPHAVQVGVGKVCAITGKRWSGTLGDPKRKGEQNYVVAPTQPWLDGICAGHGTIKQFVAMPLGSGATVEGQVTGEESIGGLQLQVFAAKPGLFHEPPPMLSYPRYSPQGGGPFSATMMGALPPPCAAAPAPSMAMPKAQSMGLAAGGKMVQKIYPDPHGRDTWDLTRSGRCFVHLCNSELYREITGEPAPPSPVDANSYKAHGYPWFQLYDEGAPALDTTSVLADVKSLGELDAEQGAPPEAHPASLFQKMKRLVRDGVW